jgi:type VI secretion system protein ImpI
MFLTLEVVSPNGAALGQNRRIVVGEQGATIGRGRTNDWVIDDPYISREHACIRYVNGAFYLEGVGKNPLAFRDPNTTLPNNEPQVLRSGERFFLDHYEIEATLSSGQQRAAPPPPLEDPFADEFPSPPPPRPVTARREIPEVGGAVDAGEGAEDVRALFGIRTQTAEPTFDPVNFEQVSPLRENFPPPKVGGRAPVTPRPTPPKPTAKRGLEDWDHTNFTAVTTSRPALVEEPTAPKPPPARTVRPEPPPSQMAGDLGEIYRIVVKGVMEALQARAQVKLEFRLDATRVQATENNPLKFCESPEAALQALLAERSRGYMNPPRAFQDGFEDLRNHQFAMMAGIRAAFNSMLEKFSPERLQESLEADSRRGALKVGKGRFPDQYAQYYRQLTGDPEECFRRLFGDVFGEAYEKQLEELKRSGGGGRD